MSTNKWSSLIGGVSPSEKPASTNGIFGIFAVIVMIAVVAILLYATSNRSGPAVTADAEVQPLEVVQAKAVEAPVEASVEAPAVDALVKPKTAFVSRLWASDAPSAAADVPFLHTDDGQGFEAFQEAFTNERQMPMIERTVSDDVEALSEPIKAAIKASGLSITQYAESRGINVPEDLVDIVQGHAAVAKVIRRDSHGLVGPNANVSEDEARLLAQEAFQTVSTKASIEAATLVLRDVLAARTEANRLGLNLPEMADEQLDAIRYWSRAGGPAGQLAKSILSRI